MSHCPHCSTPLELSEQNFGTLFNCPKCSSVFFIGWDGVPELESLILPEEQSEAVEEEIPSEIEQDFQQEPQYQQVEPIEVSEDPSLGESELLESSEEQFRVSDLNVSLESQLQAASELSMEAPSDYIAEIETFANPTAVSSSAMTYDLIIGGIDSAETLRQVREALLDSKFGWDVNEIMRGIRGGVLEIPAMNPVKAVVLLSRLKVYQLDLSWRQNVQ